jgi:TatD DNase family protein
MAKLYDTHCHLDLQKSLSLTLKEIEKNKILTIAVTNLPPLYEKLLKKIESKYVKIALGFHPELLFQYKKYIPEMWRLLPSATYIGEVGIDMKLGNENRNLQIAFFEKLISECNRLGNKILTIHSRAAVDEIISVVGNNFNSKAILHWYSGTTQSLRQAINKGYYFSVNYSMVNSLAGKKIIMEIPSDKILIETDSPLIYGSANYTVELINKIIEGIAVIKSFSAEQMENILWDNFKELQEPEKSWQ